MNSQKFGWEAEGVLGRTRNNGYACYNNAMLALASLALSSRNPWLEERTL